MPSARVGIIPHSGLHHEESAQQQSSGDRPNRQQGITMEDLKKRTAMRLAQEQQNRHCFPRLPSQGRDSMRVQQQQQDDCLSRRAAGRHQPVVQAGVEQWRPSSKAPEIESRDAEKFMASLSQPGLLSPQPRRSYLVKKDLSKSSAQSAVDERCQTNHVFGKQLTRVQPPHSTSSFNDSSTSSRRMHEGLRDEDVHYADTTIENHSHAHRSFSPQRTVSLQFRGSDSGELDLQKQRNGNRVSITGSRSNLYAPPQSSKSDASRGQKQTGTRHNKLPHGLTVHELKEMTKARLQAEAAETNDKARSVLAVFSQQGHASENQTCVPVVGHAVPAQEQDISKGFAPDQVQQCENFLDSSAPTTIVFRQKAPGNDNIDNIYATLSKQGSGDHSQSPQVLASRLPSFQSKIHPTQVSSTFSHSAGFDGVIAKHQNQCSHLQSNGNWHHLQTNADAWETASIASLNSTIGSESAYSSGIGGIPPSSDDFVNIPFARSRTYPAGSGHGVSAERPPYENTPTSTVTSASSVFDVPTTTGQNRRRACTLSPPGLSHLHEDRPLTAEGTLGDDLAIPSFDAPSQKPLSVRVNSNEILNSPPTSRGSSPSSCRLGPGCGAVGGRYCDFFNRPRASSATSLPSLSTATEFHEQQNACLPHFSPEYGQSGESPATDDLPNSVAESVLGATSSGDPPYHAHSLTDVFRNPSSAGGPVGWTTASLKGGSSASPFFDSIAGEAVDEDRRNSSWRRPSLARGCVGSHPLIQKPPLNPGQSVELSDDLGSILMLSENTEGLPGSSVSWINGDRSARHNPVPAVSSLLPSSVAAVASPSVCLRPAVTGVDTTGTTASELCSAHAISNTRREENSPVGHKSPKLSSLRPAR